MKSVKQLQTEREIAEASFLVIDARKMELYRAQQILREAEDALYPEWSKKSSRVQRLRRELYEIYKSGKAKPKQLQWLIHTRTSPKKRKRYTRKEVK